jgi:hypothetical protein
MGKGNIIHMVLVVMQIIASNMEISMGVPQKIKNRTSMLSCYTTPGHISEEK